MHLLKIPVVTVAMVYVYGCVVNYKLVILRFRICGYDRHGTVEKGISLNGESSFKNKCTEI